MSDNRSIRVFVSSTFRDMVEERDELMTQAWPELRRRCRELQVELVEVDLRWGIAEEQSTRKETLKLCLDEIRACRPFFIGLLGERYGWTPGADAFTADLQEQHHLARAGNLYCTLIAFCRVYVVPSGFVRTRSSGPVFALGTLSVRVSESVKVSGAGTPPSVAMMPFSNPLPRTST